MDTNTRIIVEDLGRPATVVGHTKDGQIVVAVDDDDDGIFELIGEDIISLMKTPAQLDEEVETAIKFAKEEYARIKDKEVEFVKSLLVGLFARLADSLARAVSDVRDAQKHLVTEVGRLRNQLLDDIDTYHAGRRF